MQKVQEEAVGLVAAYAGDKQTDIRDREQEVVDAWKNLQMAVDARKQSLLDASDLYRFFAMCLDLTMWMSDILLQMKTQEKRFLRDWIVGMLLTHTNDTILGNFSYLSILRFYLEVVHLFSQSVLMVI